MLKRKNSLRLVFFAVCLMLISGVLFFARSGEVNIREYENDKEENSPDMTDLVDLKEEIRTETTDNNIGKLTSEDQSDDQGEISETDEEKDKGSNDSVSSEMSENKTSFLDGDKQTTAVTEDMLIILQEPQLYTYEDMKQDAELLSVLYPDFVQMDSLGTTVDGRELYHFIIGDPDADNQIFISAGIHAREYITCQLVMKQTVTFLQKLVKNDTYESQTYRQLLEGSAIHVVPMINPDGISISQFGLGGIQNDSVLEQVKNIAQMDGASPEGSYLTRWKSNANGVDLNRNFDALWEQYNDNKGRPSSDHYKGTNPGSEIESAALIQLTEEENFSRIITYHSQGSVIYWYFGQSGELLDTTKAFAERIAAKTGYYTDANYENLDPAGYKDWAIDKCGIPSITIEVGRDTSPVPMEQFEEIWLRNESVWEETLLDSKK